MRHDENNDNESGNGPFKNHSSFIGPSGGQRARLLLRQSEFEFLRSVQLKLCKLLQKNENKLDSS